MPGTKRKRSEATSKESKASRADCVVEICADSDQERTFSKTSTECDGSRPPKLKKSRKSISHSSSSARKKKTKPQGDVIDLTQSDEASLASSADSGVVDNEVVGVISFSSPEPEAPSPKSSPSPNKAPSPTNEHQTLGKLSKFRIEKVTRKLLKSRGVKYLFPIQYKTFDSVYDGRDLIGQARTGTGKTLSFVLPLIEKLKAEGSLSTLWGRPPTVLVMAPTRELANQVYTEVKALVPGGMSSHCIYGGTPYEPQENAIRRGLDFLVGTPGRILDHMGRGALNLSQLRHVVLDEADQMLERGFAESVEEILAASFGKMSSFPSSNSPSTPSSSSSHSEKPQLLLFSATVPSWVQDTANRYMTPDKVVVDLIGQQRLRTAVTVDHRAICCPYSERSSTIADVIQVYSGAHGRAMVFTSTKQEANELALSSGLKQECQVLHGDIPQRQREITLKGFREGRFQVLVATDVAARGLDIPEVDLVIQSEPPKDVDSYIHRSGRTGRAGRTGVNILFYKLQQEHLVQGVERKAGITFQRIGAPQPVDIIKAGAKDAAKSLDSVPSSILPHFQEAAEQLVKGRGAVDVVASALAYISGAREIVTRSLLSAQQNFTTYLLYGDSPIRHISYFWKILERCFPPFVKESVKGIRMTKDEKGVVFDLPSDLASTVKENWQDGYVKLTTPTSLPDLKDRSREFYDKQRSNDVTRRFGRGGYGSRGGSFGGRGSFGGGRGSFGGRGNWRSGEGGANRPPQRSQSLQRSQGSQSRGGARTRYSDHRR